MIRGHGARDTGRGNATTLAVREITGFKDLRVWQKAVELVKEVYALCAKLPKEELYGLASQMKRAVVSVPSNIAEGHSRHHRAEYRQFIFVAIGSLAELETQMHIASELYFMMRTEDIEPVLEHIEHLRAMLLTLGKRLS